MSIALSRSTARTSAQSGGVDIVGFPQLLLTRQCGDPDALFIPLLEAAREALVIAKGFTSQAGSESSMTASKMAGMHIATSFLQDTRFTFAPKNSPTQSHYLLDLDAETIRVRTWLFATGGKRTSSFLVTIDGNFQIGPFTARTAGDDSVIAEFDEQRLRQPEFFSTVLPEECIRFQMNADHFKRFGSLPVAHEASGIRITLAADGDAIPVLVRRVGSSSTYEVVDERTSTRAAMLPHDATVQLEKLLETLANIFDKLSEARAESKKPAIV